MMNVPKNDSKLLFLLLITSTTDSNSIFDYFSNSTKRIKAYILDNTYVVRTINDVFVYIDQHADINNTKGDILIFRVNVSSNNNYILMNPIPKKLESNENNYDYINNKIWYVLKTVDLENNLTKDSNCNEEYYLNQNDIIKLGSVKYAVQKLYLEQKDNNLNGSEPPKPIMESTYRISDLNKDLNSVFDFVFQVKYFRGYIDINSKNKNLNENILQYKCEYCTKNTINKETDDGNNFLIAICKCKNFWHFKCLKNYFKDLMEKNNENENTIKYHEVMTFKNFQCQKCKNQYPIKFKLPGVDKIFELIEIKEPKDCNYMILESLDKENDEYSKSIHIIKFKNNGEPLTIGRDNDNDIIVRDISISRHHAIIRFNNLSGKVMIQNWKSKFGTLILVKKPITILDKKICLQVGKTYIEANLMNIEEYEKIKKEKNGY